MRLVPAVVCCLVLASVAPIGAVAGLGPTAASDSSADADERGADQPAIHAIYPDPIAAGDRGEFVVLRVPNGTDLDGYLLTDGRTTAALPNRTVSGRVALTADPEPVRRLTDYHVVPLDTAVALANGGDRVALRRADTERTVDSVRYSDSGEGELGMVRGSTVQWRPLGATDRSVVTGAADTVRAFTLPDAPAEPLAPIRNATERVYLAGYTLSSPRVAAELLAAQRRGVDVRVLLEGAPVGGRSRAEARTLDRLSDGGVDVRAVAGPRARYRYHHAKYAVADDRAVVLTENWKPAGTGGQSSRGWGVTTSQPDIVAGLAETFRADAGWHDAQQWEQFREGRRFERFERASGDYPSRFDAETVPVSSTELLVTPDNAQGALVTEIDAARDSIDVVQPTAGDWDEPLLRALRRAASRGVEVRLLLSSAWYVREENRRTVERFQDWAARTDAPLSARLAEPNDRFEKIHAKGAVLDGEQAIVGSLNWNEAAATQNREVILLLRGEAVADYFGRVFDADWSGGRPSIPIGPVGAVLGVLVVGGLAARRVRFGR